MTTNLPKTREQYLEAMKSIQSDLLSNAQANGASQTRAILLLTEAILDLKDAVEPLFEPEQSKPEIDPLLDPVPDMIK